MPGIDESIAQFIIDAGLAHQIVHGDEDTVVETAGGPVKSLAKAVGDLEESATASAAVATAAAGTATTGADTATTAAGTATGAASTATTQAGNAATSAGNAATSEGNAAAAAIAAASSAGTASGAAGTATSAAGTAAAAAAAAQAARDLAQAYAAALAGSSATSLTIGTGEKVFTTQAGKQWALGQRLRAASDDGTKVMDGEVTAYSGTSLTLDVDHSEGAGTHDDWNLSIVGGRGGTGATGATWYSGNDDPDNGDGVDGDHYLQLIAGGSGGIGSVWKKITGAWSLQGNIRGPAGTGDVNGPAGATNNELVIFDGATGKLVKASGVLLAAIALLASPTFTGTPAAPTAAGGTNTTQIATTAFVQSAIATIINSSPSALDTLNELAAALGNDANFATTVTNALAAKAPLASPALTGNPTAPTQSALDNSTKIATTAYVDSIFSSYIRTLLDDANATAARTTLELGSAALATIGTSGDTVPKNNTANTFSLQLTLASTANSPLLLDGRVTQNGAGGGAFRFSLISSDPAIADVPGEFQWAGRNSAAADAMFSRLRSTCALVTAGAHAGIFTIYNAVAGAETPVLNIDAGVFATGEASMGLGTINMVNLYRKGDSLWDRAVKVWAYATVSSNVPTLQDSVNVTSITDTATGRMVITFDDDFANTKYAANVTAANTTGTSAWANESSGTRAVGSIEVYNRTTLALADPVAWNFAASGDIA